MIIKNSIVRRIKENLTGKCCCCAITVLLFMPVFTLVYSQPSEVRAAEEILPSGVSKGQLEEEIDAYVEGHRDTTAGMAVTVFDGTDELLKKYYGYIDVERQIAAAPDSVFEWGSMSKLLVWVSVMQLYEQGKLDLECDIRRYHPEGFLTNLSYDDPVTKCSRRARILGRQTFP